MIHNMKRRRALTALNTRVLTLSKCWGLVWAGLSTKQRTPLKYIWVVLNRPHRAIIRLQQTVLPNSPLYHRIFSIRTVQYEQKIFNVLTLFAWSYHLALRFVSFYIWLLCALRILVDETGAFFSCIPASSPPHREWNCWITSVPTRQNMELQTPLEYAIMSLSWAQVLFWQARFEWCSGGDLGLIVKCTMYNVHIVCVEEYEMKLADSHF